MQGRPAKQKNRRKKLRTKTSQSVSTSTHGLVGGSTAGEKVNLAEKTAENSFNLDIALPAERNNRFSVFLKNQIRILLKRFNKKGLTLYALELELIQKLIEKYCKKGLISGSSEEKYLIDFETFTILHTIFQDIINYIGFRGPYNSDFQAFTPKAEIFFSFLKDHCAVKVIQRNPDDTAWLRPDSKTYVAINGNNFYFNLSFIWGAKALVIIYNYINNFFQGQDNGNDLLLFVEAMEQFQELKELEQIQVFGEYAKWPSRLNTLIDLFVIISNSIKLKNSQTLTDEEIEVQKVAEEAIDAVFFDLTQSKKEVSKKKNKKGILKQSMIKEEKTKQVLATKKDPTSYPDPITYDVQVYFALIDKDNQKTDRAYKRLTLCLKEFEHLVSLDELSQRNINEIREKNQQKIMRNKLNNRKEQQEAKLKQKLANKRKGNVPTPTENTHPSCAHSDQNLFKQEDDKKSPYREYLERRIEFCKQQIAELKPILFVKKSNEIHDIIKDSVDIISDQESDSIQLAFSDTKQQNLSLLLKMLHEYNIGFELVRVKESIDKTQVFVKLLHISEMDLDKFKAAFLKYQSQMKTQNEPTLPTIPKTLSEDTQRKMQETIRQLSPALQADIDRTVSEKKEEGYKERVKERKKKDAEVMLAYRIRKAEERGATSLLNATSYKSSPTECEAKESIQDEEYQSAEIYDERKVLNAFALLKEAHLDQKYLHSTLLGCVLHILFALQSFDKNKLASIINISEEIANRYIDAFNYIRNRVVHGCIKLNLSDLKLLADELFTLKPLFYLHQHKNSKEETSLNEKQLQLFITNAYHLLDETEEKQITFCQQYNKRIYLNKILKLCHQYLSYPFSGSDPDYLYSLGMIIKIQECINLLCKHDRSFIFLKTTLNLTRNQIAHPSNIENALYDGCSIYKWDEILRVRNQIPELLAQVELMMMSVFDRNISTTTFSMWQSSSLDSDTAKPSNNPPDSSLQG